MTDDLETFTKAQDAMERLRLQCMELRDANVIDCAYYDDVRDTLTYIDGALLTGKTNTAMLRNARRMQ